jgi:hypothetical protein
LVVWHEKRHSRICVPLQHLLASEGRAPKTSRIDATLEKS